MIRRDGSDGMERESLMTSIVGTWRLVRAEAFDASGKPQPALYGGTPMGRVMFTSSGRMMAMTGDGRQGAHADQVREYNTYAGATHLTVSGSVPVSIPAPILPIWAPSKCARSATKVG